MVMPTAAFFIARPVGMPDAGAVSSVKTTNQIKVA